MSTSAFNESDVVRQRPGQPTGGQFAEKLKAASGLTLADHQDQMRTVLSSIDWEDGLDRQLYDRSLPNLPPSTRDAAWQTAEHLAAQGRRVEDGDYIDPDDDAIASNAYDAATDYAAEFVGSSESEYDERFTERYDELLSEGYRTATRDLADALLRMNDGHEVTMQPPKDGLPAFAPADAVEPQPKAA